MPGPATTATSCPCQTRGWEDRKETCFGETMWVCECTAYDESGECVDSAGTWQEGWVPANCTCGQMAAGLCAIPVG